jgi:CBS domain containing-hemolysin-like protein
MIALVLILIFIILAGLFAGIETGFVSLDRVRFKVARIDKRIQKNVVNSYIKHPDKFLTTTLLGTNITNILCATILTTYILHRFPDSADIISALILLPITLIFAEIIPKSIFREYPNKLTLKFIIIFNLFHKLFYIPINILSSISNFILGEISNKKKKKNPFLTKEELLILTKGEHKDYDKFTYETARKIFIFGEKSVKDILIPVNKMIGIDIKWNLKRIKKEFISSKLNYLPVYDGTKSNLIGILNSKALLFLSDESDIKDFLIRIESLNSDITLEKGLTRFQMLGIPLMLVKFKQRTIGIVTLRDIIKQLF